MSIRTKSLCILLAISLAPLVALTLLNKRGAQRLAMTLANATRHDLTNMVSKELQNTAKSYSDLLLRDKVTMELLTLNLGWDAEDVLSDPSPEARTLFFASQFDDPAAAPPDIKPVPEYVRQLPDGSRENEPVSMGHAVIYQAESPKATRLVEDAPAGLDGRLSRMQGILKRLYDVSGGFLFRCYVSLESGVHIAYPGHGGFPEGYDPRRRPWYTGALAADGLVWTTAVPDATTNLFTFTVSCPVRDDAGKVIGVAGIDVLVTQILDTHALSSQWSDKIQAFIVSAQPNPKTGKTGLLALCSNKPDDVSHWAARMGNEWLPLPEGFDDHLQSMVEAIQHGEDGFTEAPFDGEDSIWAYDGLQEHFFLLIVTPKSVVMTVPDMASRLILDVSHQQLTQSGLAAAVVIALVTVIALLGARRVSQPILAMAAAARRLAQGDFSARVGYAASDERGEVIQALDEMGPKLEDLLRLKQSLALAQEVQQNLLPAGPPAVEGYDICGLSRYCDETGGDYIDFFPTSEQEDDGLVVCVGDVSGHGLPSALLMATARAELRALTAAPGGLAEHVSTANRLLCQDISNSSRFMTLFVLELRPAEKSVRWVRAGHDPALLYRPVDDAFEELDGEGVLLGVMADFVYQAYEREFATSGDIIVLGTDGIWEARNPNDEMFGKERLMNLIRDNASRSAKAIQDAVIAALDDFLGGRPQEDDVTLAVIKKR